MNLTSTRHNRPANYEFKTRKSNIFLLSLCQHNHRHHHLILCEWGGRVGLTGTLSLGLILACCIATLISLAFSNKASRSPVSKTIPSNKLWTVTFLEISSPLAGALGDFSDIQTKLSAREAKQYLALADVESMVSLEACLNPQNLGLFISHFHSKVQHD